VNFIYLDGPTRKYLIKTSAIVWVEYEVKDKILKMKMDNGDFFELPEVTNLREVAKWLGVDENIFRMKIIKSEH